MATDEEKNQDEVARENRRKRAREVKRIFMRDRHDCWCVAYGSRLERGLFPGSIDACDDGRYQRVLGGERTHQSDRPHFPLAVYILFDCAPRHVLLERCLDCPCSGHDDAFALIFNGRRPRLPRASRCTRSGFFLWRFR